MPVAFYPVKQTCPLCGAHFSTSRVRSSACRAVKRHSDFHVTYQGNRNPLLYSIFVCPNCHYAAVDKNFNDPVENQYKEMLEKTLAISIQDKTDYTGERNPETGLLCHKLAVLCGELSKRNTGYLAGIYLRCAWLCRDLERPDEEKVFLEKARLLYLKAYETERHLPGKLTEPKLLYLLGELHRRLALYRDAVNWFNRASVHPGARREPEMNRLIRDQWQLAREQFKKEKEAAASTGDSTAAKDTPVPLSFSVSGSTAQWLSSFITDEALLEPDRLGEIVQNLLLGLQEAGVRLNSGRITLVRDDIRSLVKS